MFNSISPLDYRYHLPEIEEYFSEEASIKYMARVEVALVETLAARGLCPRESVGEIQQAAESITAAVVYEEEKKTRHDIRALVNVLRSRVSDTTKPWIHWCATSYDIRDTAHVMQMKDGLNNIVLPQLVALVKILIVFARKEKDTIQIGRTHGQHAVPITVGFWIAGFIERLGTGITQLSHSVGRLKGKFSGAVGAYNSLSLFIDNPEGFEREVLKKLNMEPAAHSTQIIPPEYVLDVLHHATAVFGVIANIARDMRSLQRTEIGEIGEEFSADQVGSSTMPHKRNPITFENVESLWKTFVPRMTTYYLDQVSEHQRDLTNSASARFQFEMLAALTYAARRLNGAIEKLKVDAENLKKNFDQSREAIIAEPLYLLLARAGHPDAHETVKQLTLRAQREGVQLAQLAEAEYDAYLEKCSPAHRAILTHVEEYHGRAIEKTEDVCSKWDKAF